MIALVIAIFRLSDGLARAFITSVWSSGWTDTILSPFPSRTRTSMNKTGSASHVGERYSPHAEIISTLGPDKMLGSILHRLSSIRALT